MWDLTCFTQTWGRVWRVRWDRFTFPAISVRGMENRTRCVPTAHSLKASYVHVGSILHACFMLPFLRVLTWVCTLVRKTEKAVCARNSTGPNYRNPPTRLLAPVSKLFLKITMWEGNNKFTHPYSWYAIILFLYSLKVNYEKSVAVKRNYQLWNNNVTISANRWNNSYKHLCAVIIIFIRFHVLFIDYRTYFAFILPLPCGAECISRQLSASVSCLLPTEAVTQLFSSQVVVKKAYRLRTVEFLKNGYTH